MAKENGSKPPCDTCNGTGEVLEERPSGLLGLVQCPDCRGTGRQT